MIKPTNHDSHDEHLDIDWIKMDYCTSMNYVTTVAFVALSNMFLMFNVEMG